MKYICAGLLATFPTVAAFVPSKPAIKQWSTLSATTAIVTGPKGKAAVSFEEDLMLTLQIIRDHDARSTTVSTEQFISQMQEIKNKPDAEEPIDVSIPYDAAAMLAFEASDKTTPYADFKTKYEANAVEMVKAKQARKVKAADEPKKEKQAESVDLTIPYDAAARLAFESSDKSVPYVDFKSKYEADTIAMVKAKQPKKTNPVRKAENIAAAKTFEKREAESVAEIVDISIPYDAAARLAFEASDKSLWYGAFKAKYEADTIAMVKAKQQKKIEALEKKKPATTANALEKPQPVVAAASEFVDLSIPYDAAARLAFEASDKSLWYGAFKAKYEVEAIAQVIAKKKARESL